MTTPLGLVGASSFARQASMPLTDAVFTAPVVAGGRVYVVDGSGAAAGAKSPLVSFPYRTFDGNYVIL